MSVTGFRLPYAPRTTLTAGLSYQHRGALDARVEAVYLGRQFGDALNTTTTVADGQQGILPASTLWNVAVNYTIRVTGGTMFVMVQNLFDRLYISDRTRGLLPGVPRSLQVGIAQPF